MRSLILILALMFCTASASATGIPSAASGIYVTPDRVCRVVFARYQVTSLQADLTCMSFATGALTFTLSTLYAPEAGSCWPAGAAVPFNAQTPTDYVSWVAYFDQDAGALGALVGNQAQVVNGDGNGQKWVRVATIESPAPYTCGAPAPSPVTSPHYARLCRQHGLFCGG